MDDGYLDMSALPSSGFSSRRGSTDLLSVPECLECPADGSDLSDTSAGYSWTSESNLTDEQKEQSFSSLDCNHFSKHPPMASSASVQPLSSASVSSSPKVPTQMLPSPVPLPVRTPLPPSVPLPVRTLPPPLPLPVRTPIPPPVPPRDCHSTSMHVVVPPNQPINMSTPCASVQQSPRRTSKHIPNQGFDSAQDYDNCLNQSDDCKTSLKACQCQRCVKTLTTSMKVPVSLSKDNISPALPLKKKAMKYIPPTLPLPPVEGSEEWKRSLGELIYY